MSKNFDPKSFLKLDIILFLLNLFIVSSNLNIRGELKIKNKKKIRKIQKSKKNQKNQKSKNIFVSVLICVLSFLLVLFCLEKWFQVKMKLMEFVLKISESKPRLWASKNCHSKEQEMKIIFSTFNPSTPEARWSWNWRLCDGLHWSLLNQSNAIYKRADVIQQIRSLCSL